MIIGTFTPNKEGGWIGTIRTLLIDLKVRIVANDNQTSDASPAYRLLAGQSEIGAAWRKRSSGADEREYLSVRLQDPALAFDISAALFQIPDSEDLQLVWRRAAIQRAEAALPLGGP